MSTQPSIDQPFYTFKVPVPGGQIVAVILGFYDQSLDELHAYGEKIRTFMETPELQEIWGDILKAKSKSDPEVAETNSFAARFVFLREKERLGLGYSAGYLNNFMFISADSVDLPTFCHESSHWRRDAWMPQIEQTDSYTSMKDWVFAQFMDEAEAHLTEVVQVDPYNDPGAINFVNLILFIGQNAHLSRNELREVLINQHFFKDGVSEATIDDHIQKLSDPLTQRRAQALGGVWTLRENLPQDVFEKRATYYYFDQFMGPDSDWLDYYTKHLVSQTWGETMQNHLQRVPSSTSDAHFATHTDRGYVAGLVQRLSDMGLTKKQIQVMENRAQLIADVTQKYRDGTEVVSFQDLLQQVHNTIIKGVDPKSVGNQLNGSNGHDQQGPNQSSR